MGPDERLIKEDWHLVFTDSTYKSWFMDMLEPNFCHVYAMKKTDGGNFWHIVDLLRSHLKISQELVSEFPHPRAWAGPDATILSVSARIDRAAPIGTLCIFTCVDVVKALTGIRAPFVFTPFQLYNHIMRVKR